MAVRAFGRWSSNPILPSTLQADHSKRFPCLTTYTFKHGRLTAQQEEKVSIGYKVHYSATTVPRLSRALVLRMLPCILLSIA